MTTANDATIVRLTSKITKFRDERDWKQFHSLKNLIASLSIESAEMTALLQWKSDCEADELLDDAEFREKLSDEVADVLIYLLLIAEKARIDPIDAAYKKIARNEQRYPVEKSRGNSKKYNEI